jgi:hypothetical protein
MCSRQALVNLGLRTCTLDVSSCDMGHLIFPTLRSVAALGLGIRGRWPSPTLGFAGSMRASSARARVAQELPIDCCPVRG